MSADRKPGFNTLAIHAGAQPDPATGARATPIYQTTSYVFEDVDHAAALFDLETFGNIYTRIKNPTRPCSRSASRRWRGARPGSPSPPGMRRRSSSFHALMEPGDEFVAARQLYGGSINQFTHSFKKFDWNVQFGRYRRMPELRAGAYAEDQGDLRRVDRQSRRHHHRHRGYRGGRQARLACRSSSTIRWPRPISCRPHRARRRHHRSFADQVSRRPRQLDRRRHRRLRHVRLVQERALSDAVGALALLSRRDFRRDLRQFRLRHRLPRVLVARSRAGASRRSTPSSFSPASRRCRLRMQRHCDNTLAVAEWLSKHDQVTWVNYAGLPGNKYQRACQDAIARRAPAPCSPSASKGGYRGRRQAREQRQAVQPSRQYRRYAEPDHPSRLDHPSPAHHERASRGRRS